MEKSNNTYRLPKLTSRTNKPNSKYLKSHAISEACCSRTARQTNRLTINNQSISDILREVKNQYKGQQENAKDLLGLKELKVLKLATNETKTERRQKKVINNFSIAVLPKQNRENTDRESIFANFNESLDRNLIVQEISLLEKPPHRYKTQMVAYQNSLLLFGGIGCQKNLTWAKITVNNKNQISLQKPLAKSSLDASLQNTSFYGHTMKAYRSNAYIFGGVNGDVLKDLVVFNLKTLKYKHGIAAPFRRKQHAATMLGRFMIIYGGIEGNETKNSLFYYDTELCKWTVLPSVALPCLSNHGMVTVPVRNKRKVTSISENKDWIYIFGGKDEKGESNNKLYRLQVVSDFEIFFEEIKLQNPSVVPKKRHSFCFEYVENGNILLYGGKEDEESYEQNLRNGTFNDTYLFNIHKRAWRKQETKVGYRKSMTSCSVNGKVYIYGGFEDLIYADGNVLMMKISQNGNLQESRASEQIGTRETLQSRRQLEFS